MKITLFVLAAFVCVQIATAASKSKEKAIEVSTEASSEAKLSAKVEKSKGSSESLKKKAKSGSLSVEESKSEWKKILEQVTTIVDCLKEGKDLKSALKLKEDEKISILEKLEEKVNLTLKSLEKGKGIGDLSEVSENIKIVKEIQEKISVIGQLVEKGKDVSGLLDAEATVKIVSELKINIQKLVNASGNLAAKESNDLLDLLKGKGLLDLDLIKSIAPIIAELQKKGIDLGVLDLKNIGDIDIACIQKTVEKIIAALKGGADIQNILSLAGAKKLGISGSELKGLHEVLGLVGKLVGEGASKLKNLLNLQGGASILKPLLPLPLL